MKHRCNTVLILHTIKASMVHYSVPCSHISQPTDIWFHLQYKSVVSGFLILSMAAHLYWNQSPQDRKIVMLDFTSRSEWNILLSALSYAELSCAVHPFPHSTLFTTLCNPIFCCHLVSQTHTVNSTSTTCHITNQRTKKHFDHVQKPSLAASSPNHNRWCHVINAVKGCEVTRTPFDPFACIVLYAHAPLLTKPLHKIRCHKAF